MFWARTVALGIVLLPTVAFGWETPPPLPTNGREPVPEFLRITKGMPKNDRIYAEAMAYRTLVRCAVLSISDKYGALQAGLSIYNEAANGDCFSEYVNYMRYCQINTMQNAKETRIQDCDAEYIGGMIGLTRGAMSLGDLSYSAPVPKKMYDRSR